VAPGATTKKKYKEKTSVKYIALPATLPSGLNKKHLKNVGPIRPSRLTPIHQVSLAVLSRAACASMSTTTRDRGDRYGPMEWAQKHDKTVRGTLNVTI